MSYVHTQRSRREQCPRCAWPNYEITNKTQSKYATIITRKCAACFSMWAGRPTHYEYEQMMEYEKNKNSREAISRTAENDRALAAETSATDLP